MKSNFFKLLSFSLFSILLLNAGQSFAQGDISRGTDKKTAQGVSAKPNPLKGEYTKKTDCVDLFVKKGCVNYSVCVVGDKACDKAAVVKACVNQKPVTICKKGAKGITVKYEKLDATTDIEFKEFVPNDNKNNKKQ